MIDKLKKFFQEPKRNLTLNFFMNGVIFEFKDNTPINRLKTRSTKNLKIRSQRKEKYSAKTRKEGNLFA